MFIIFNALLRIYTFYISILIKMYVESTADMLAFDWGGNPREDGKANVFSSNRPGLREIRADV